MVNIYEPLYTVAKSHDNEIVRALETRMETATRRFVIQYDVHVGPSTP